MCVIQEEMMKKMFALLTVVILLSACSANQSAIQTAVAGTEAVAPKPQLPVATDTPIPLPTNTPAPLTTNTPLPSPTDTPVPPTQAPITIAMVEKALLDNGFTRFPSSSVIRPGKSSFIYLKGNPYNQVEVWADGLLTIDLLSNKDAAIRAQSMEDKFLVLDQVFPKEFMTTLRLEFDKYNKASTGMISGKPAKTWVTGNYWQEVYARYSVSDVTIGSLPIEFSLFFWQMTCPPNSLYCWMSDFPGEVFYGENSYTFEDMEIMLTP
jgi:hypothetical protein